MSVPTTPSLVEIVVAALVRFDLNDQLPDYNETLRKAARAAIEAMREVPLDAFARFEGYCGSDLIDKEAQAIYQQVIDAALKP